MQVELPAELAATADRVKVLDHDDHPLPINVFMGNSRQTLDDTPLEAGRSHVMVVTEDAATLVLLKNGEEVRRVPLSRVTEAGGARWVETATGSPWVPSLVYMVWKERRAA